MTATLINEFESQLNIQQVDVGGMLECGLRQNWISGEGEDLEFSMDCGAGLGSPWLLITVKKPGEEDMNFRANMKEFLGDLIQQIS
ncbi:hypothetical protein [Gimesia aquarii]|uniref:Uncharacterized protein n=1 Tax=Gimesia aquarii TaxID=2527964 RepID=A0A517X1C5_9PLAN|nr:hypothetical protein [Gimesia aquarii]QDU11299.1 hypothetical protein V202x_47180 [Gimesia aquarii]